MKNKLPVILLVVVVLGYLGLELFGPKPTDWSTSYGNNRITPFGSQLLYEGLQDLFPGSEIVPVDQPLHKQLLEFEDSPSNYIIVQQSLDLTQKESEALLRYVENGNTVFLAASVFEGELGKELGLDPDDFWNLFFSEKISRDDYVEFVKQHDPDNVHYPLLDNVYYNSLPGHAVTEILSRNRDGKVVYGRIDRGNGHLYIHSIPLLFTNYFMVDPVNHRYLSEALTFLPDQKTYWDEYYKPGRSRIESPVSYLMDQPALRWAWYLLLGTIVLFIVFQGKRTQRIVPVVEPPANDTLEFTKTVGQLYYQHGDHHDIALKKIRYLLEYIRNRWNLPTQNLDEAFRKRLHQRTGIPRLRIDQLMDLAEKIRGQEKTSEASLSALHQMTEDFYHTVR